MFLQFSYTGSKMLTNIYLYIHTVNGECFEEEKFCIFCAYVATMKLLHNKSKGV